jgi:hypothetical protein
LNINYFPLFTGTTVKKLPIRAILGRSHIAGVAEGDKGAEYMK